MYQISNNFLLLVVIYLFTYPNSLTPLNPLDTVFLKRDKPTFCTKDAYPIICEEVARRQHSIQPILELLGIIWQIIVCVEPIHGFLYIGGADARPVQCHVEPIGIAIATALLTSEPKDIAVRILVALTAVRGYRQHHLADARVSESRVNEKWKVNSALIRCQAIDQDSNMSRHLLAAANVRKG